MDSSSAVIVGAGLVVLGLGLYVVAVALSQSRRGRRVRFTLPRFSLRSADSMRRQGFDRRQNTEKLTFPTTIDGRYLREDRRRAERRRRP